MSSGRWKVRITRIRRRLGSVQASETAGVLVFCPECRNRVQALTIRQAADLMGIGHEAIQELVHAGQAHTIPLISGGYLICQDSLFPTT
jgi:hypothetical protein